MSNVLRMCYDKILPRDLFRAHELQPVPAARGVRAIMPRGKKWPVGATLRVRFLDGNADQRRMVERFAPAWSNFANLTLVFDNSPQAEIRITFDAGDGAWSYLGTDCREIPNHAATMNLGWQDEAVILHEFGHALGLAHEHQNPSGGIEWNEAVVIRDLSGPPNNWDEATIRHNVLQKYSFDQINGTEFDKDSIMLYAFPASWTRSGVGTRENNALSELDKRFIASAAAYPGKGTPAPNVVTLSVAEIPAVAAKIASAGELDHFTFKATKAGHYTIETEGTADLVMKLFGPDSNTRMLAEDDDSGVGTNPRIDADLVPGTYYVQVRHYDPNSTGDYKIRVYF